MTLFVWLIVGIVSGVFAKALVPKMEKGDWFFASLIAIVGAMMGGFAGEISGISADIPLVEMAIAAAGALITLLFFREYIAVD